MACLKVGDIVFTNSDSFIGWTIRKFTQHTKETPTETNHCGIIGYCGHIESEKFPTAWIVEAYSKVFLRSLYGAYHGKAVKLSVFRPINISYDEKEKLREAALRYVGRKYGWFKIGLHALDYILGGKVWFRRLAFLDKYPICSYLVAMCYREIGKDFGLDARFASPDDIHDFCIKNPDKYEKILDWAHI